MLSCLEFHSPQNHIGLWFHKMPWMCSPWTGAFSSMVWPATFSSYPNKRLLDSRLAVMRAHIVTGETFHHLLLHHVSSCNYYMHIDINPIAVLSIVGLYMMFFFPLLFWLAVSEPSQAAAVLTPICEHGSNQCPARLPEQHCQCWEAWKTPSSDQAQFQGHHQVSAGDAEARLHWRLGDYWWPPSRKSSGGAHWPHQQVWCDLSQVRCFCGRNRAACQWPPSISSVWPYRLDHDLRHHGSWGGTSQTRGWQDCGLLLLRGALFIGSGTPTAWSKKFATISHLEAPCVVEPVSIVHGSLFVWPPFLMVQGESERSSEHAWPGWHLVNMLNHENPNQIDAQWYNLQFEYASLFEFALPNFCVNELYWDW